MTFGIRYHNLHSDHKKLSSWFVNTSPRIALTNLLAIFLRSLFAYGRLITEVTLTFKVILSNFFKNSLKIVLSCFVNTSCDFNSVYVMEINCYMGLFVPGCLSREISSFSVFSFSTEKVWQALLLRNKTIKLFVYLLFNQYHKVKY